MAVRQMTRSYLLTKILNGFGNAASHSAVLSLDIALAYQQLNRDVVIPNSVVRNTLTTMVWDNIDFQKKQQLVLEQRIKFDIHFPFLDNINCVHVFEFSKDNSHKLDETSINKFIYFLYISCF